ncbi:MAG: hypothetical protein FJ270_07580 [Planctomycetes bacterium]|nr:hypothetical protein [Planctomycetota bacterium]
MHRPITTAVMLAIAMLPCTGCDDGATYSTATPTPTAAPSASAPAAETATAGQQPAAPTGARQSSSVLGKARDSALDVRDQMEARDREIQKQIDDIQP